MLVNTWACSFVFSRATSVAEVKDTLPVACPHPTRCLMFLSSLSIRRNREIHVGPSSSTAFAQSCKDAPWLIAFWNRNATSHGVNTRAERCVPTESNNCLNSISDSPGSTLLVFFRETLRYQPFANQRCRRIVQRCSFLASIRHE